jgi:hypothetical protein
MIVQMTRTRNECFLIKEMLPIWKKYADGFVFISDSSTDDTLEYLHANKEKYNILEILESNENVKAEEYETNCRQKLFDAACKYSNNLICLDTDEYLDGLASKENLEFILDKNKNTTLMLQWIQYTSKNKIRIDSPWDNVYHDRVGNFGFDAKFGKAFSHSSHLPYNHKATRVDPQHLFIAHLQWLDKRWVGIKQYFWKVWDYVANLEQGVHIINRNDYDLSVNNFNWIYKDFNFPLQIREDIYSTQSIADNFKLQYIKKYTKKYNIPNLGDWNMGIYKSCLED